VDKSSLIRARSLPHLNLIITTICFVDTHLLVPIIALYSSSLGASVEMIGLIVGLYSVTNIPANVFFGRIIDRVGFKKPLIVGLLGDAICMFCYSICRLPVHLAVLRGFHGLMGGVAGPATMSAAAERAGTGQRGRTMGFYGMALAMATLVGYGLSGVLASRLGYTSVFYFGSALLLVGMLLTFALPRSEVTTREKVEISAGEQFKKISRLFQRRELIASYCCIFAIYFAFGGIVTLLPLHIKSLGMETFHIGMLLTIFVVFFILIQFPSGIISDRVGRWIPIITGLLIGIIFLIVLPSVDTFIMLATIMALYGTGYALVFPSISALVVDHTTPEEQGVATGIFHGLLTAGVAVGAPVMGWATGLVGIELGLTLSSGVIALVLILILAMLGTHRT